MRIKIFENILVFYLERETSRRESTEAKYEEKSESTQQEITKRTRSSANQRKVINFFGTSGNSLNLNLYLNILKTP